VFNIVTAAETNYYKILQGLNEFDPTEIATLAGSTINHEVALVGTGMTNIRDAFKYVVMNNYAQRQRRKNINRRKRSQTKQRYKQIQQQQRISNTNWRAQAVQTIICRHPSHKIKETAPVGAGIGGGFQHTIELHVMKYDEVCDV